MRAKIWEYKNLGSLGLRILIDTGFKERVALYMEIEELVGWKWFRAFYDLESCIHNGPLSWTRYSACYCLKKAFLLELNCCENCICFNIAAFDW